MKKAIINLEFHSGIDIEDALSEAIRLAKALGVTCKFNFNGVICSVNEYVTVETGVEAYHRGIRNRLQSMSTMQE